MAHQFRLHPDLFRPMLLERSAPNASVNPTGVRGAIVRGRAEVIALRPLLMALSRQTGQAGALDQIELLVMRPTALKKAPCMVLVGLRPEVTPERARAEDVEGAVLFYEYLLAGVGTGIYATDDVSGERTVLGRAPVRLRVAEEACRILIAHGAAVCLASVSDAAAGPMSVVRGDQRSPLCRVALRVRTQARDLELGGSVNETLAAFGKNTRRNFRRYRQRLEEDLGAEFVPDVRISPEEFLELNHASTNPVSDDEAAWRYHFATSSSQRLFAGLRDGRGRWLSLVGGTRYPEHTYIEWQVNRNGLPKYSLSTVLRSFLLEHETAIGTRRLLFKGGTPHSMGLSLKPAETIDVVVARRGVRGWVLRRLAHWIFPRSNFLGRALQDESLAWIA